MRWGYLIPNDTKGGVPPEKRDGGAQRASMVKVSLGIALRLCIDNLPKFYPLVCRTHTHVHAYQRWLQSNE